MSNTTKLVIYALALVVLACLGIFITQSWLQRRKILAEGIRVDGTVLELIEAKKTKRRSNSSQYLVKVGLFLKPASTLATPLPVPPPSPSPKTREELKKDIDAKLDKLFASSTASQPLGDYETMSLPVSQGLFHLLKVGRVASKRKTPRKRERVRCWRIVASE